jgi:hypothetical protein
VIGFIEHLQIVTTSNYNTNLCTLLLTTAHAKSSVPGNRSEQCPVLMSLPADDCLTSN